MTILLESAIRVTLIAAVIALVLFAMRIKTASARHAVWAGVVILMMLLPAWVAWGPKASLPVLPPDRTPVVARLPPPLPAGLVSTAPVSPVSNPAPSPARKGGGYMAIYLFGVGVFLLRLAIGTIRASRLTSSSCVVPVTVGLLHPRIILPESSRDWPQAQLDAVLAHESEHIRRRDPLVQWIALLNRAIFWFHPLAWWLERRLSGLAEEACDAAVLARGYDAREYSEYLLDLARSVEHAGARIDAVGMAMPGIGLKYRIRQMLSGVPVPRISRPRMACTVAVCAAAAAILAAGTLVRAQSQSAKSDTPKFDVASLREDPGGIRPGGPPVSLSPRRTGGRFTWSAPKMFLVRYAYHLPAWRIAGIGKDESIYTVAATMDAAATEDQVRLMLQALLVERFKIVSHREIKLLPGYALVVAKNGPKLKTAKTPEEAPPMPEYFGGKSSGAFEGRIVTSMEGIGISAIMGRGVSVQQLADEISEELGAFVLDQTGMIGKYYFAFKFLSARSGPNDAAEAPSVFEAAQDELGLKLEKQRGPVEILVIDHLDKLSEN